MKEELLKLVNETLNRLYENEKFLFENNCSERNMVFHFSRYFIDCLKEKNSEFMNYDVDCEYNRNILDERKYKYITNGYKKYRIFPDFILHIRGNNENNILAIEFKKKNNKRNENDILKLNALTSSNGCYKYRLGLFIQLGKRREDVRVDIFTDGRREKRMVIL